MLPLPLLHLCCWTTDVYHDSGASSKSAWQEKSHLSVTFLCYLIMIRCDDVVTSCMMQYKNRWLNYVVEKQKRWFFIGKLAFLGAPSETAGFSYGNSSFLVGAPKSTVSFTIGNVQFVLERHFGSWWTMKKVNGKPYLRTRFVISTSLFRRKTHDFGQERHEQISEKMGSLQRMCVFLMPNA